MSLFTEHTSAVSKERAAAKDINTKSAEHQRLAQETERKKSTMEQLQSKVSDCSEPVAFLFFLHSASSLFPTSAFTHQSSFPSILSCVASQKASMDR